MSVFRKLKQFYLPYKKDFIWSMIFLLVVTGITVVYPMILQQTIDNVILGGQYDLVPWMALGFIAIMALKAWSTFIQHYLADMFGIQSVRALRDALYEKLQRLPFGYYDNAKTGDLMSRLTSDVEGFRFFLAFGFSELLRFLIMVGASFCVMLYYSPTLTFVTVAALPFLAVVVYQFDKRVHPAFRGIRQSFGKLNTKVQENISGIHTVKALSKEATEIERFNEKNGNLRTSQLVTSALWAKYFPLMEAIGNICVVLLLAYGGYLVTHHQLQPGELVAFYSLTWYILGPIMQLGFTINMFSQAKASGERLLEILEAEETIRDDKADASLTTIRGEVEFRNVTLHYRNKAALALENISFYAHPGKTIGLIGATGSGKSSITHLISRFYERNKGEILIDGRPIEHYPLKTLRSHVGVVMQETFLFSSTIKANIAYGRPDATMEEIIEAAKRAGAHDFIMELPEGYDTILGERGLGLSGGQKQRIAIARAICKNPSILILDDATSAVDMETEFRIQSALREVMKGKTTFIIGHRISSLKHADEIFVLDQGRIVERGTHEELLRQNGLYKRIYDIQYRDQATVLQETAR
ncbi:ABC transporter ATP-binding protein [Saccharococcus caldoxylosilyticus]|uniref:ABC transporter ATP-binding protein n=1 Tax=Saccharococcus caldoxylosilyticus TaxID=81408 RepID=UPI001FCAF152|nr:ABC transporter ATP-binding protein [Parageobacillus caldoxylosilyticus]BDG34646.1 putative ABC transporter ATP-binding protein YknU [Parageobacillus caldoxylosilyticus]BDG38419.1 putative ABC transporter ATP-binding protein YknU [Parageobacillus caldoxylosilyticus]BDG42207.1 putative ABC transporter ATP-binding protein YknU [Parageobacillus caldoxylosilyticus]